MFVSKKRFASLLQRRAGKMDLHSWQVFTIFFSTFFLQGSGKNAIFAIEMRTLPDKKSSLEQL